MLTRKKNCTHFNNILVTYFVIIPKSIPFVPQKARVIQRKYEAGDISVREKAFRQAN
jgi:hypothetical protein